MSCSRINFASSITGVSGLTQSTPLCIASLTFMTVSLAGVRPHSMKSSRSSLALSTLQRIGPSGTRRKAAAVMRKIQAEALSIQRGNKIEMEEAGARRALS